MKMDAQFHYGLVGFVNIIGWVLFVSTMNHALEITIAILSFSCVYVAYEHKQADTPLFMGMERPSPTNLLYTYAFEAA